MNHDVADVFAQLAIVALAAVLSAGLIVLLKPLLARYALVRPNTRSSHAAATPQGGGVAVIAATLVAATLAAMFMSGVDRAELLQLWLIFGAVIALAVVGAVDDVVVLAATPRLLVQFIAVTAVLMLLPPEIRVVPMIPTFIERVLLLVAGVWMVNLTNFMDGLDWMTVIEVVPVTGGLTILSLMGALPTSATLVSLALLGAVIGFAPFNRPTAKLFLGDVGSLPIGLLLFWLLLELAGRGHVAAALLLPLYYLADATLTVLGRLGRGENIMRAHRGHFYQRATARGLSVADVLGRVFAVNVGLLSLAVVAVWAQAAAVDVVALVCGGALVAWLLVTLARGKR